MELKVIFVLLLLGVLGYSIPFHPAQQFSTDFKIWLQYNATLGYANNNALEPFLWSPAISPLQGKMYFDWTQQGFRFEVKGGPGAPWDFDTTFIVHPNKIIKGPNSFNVSWNLYEYYSDGRCWYSTASQDNLPYTLDGLDKNTTFVDIETVDGYTCAVFKSGTGNLYSIRIPDLAIIKAEVPYIGSLPLPIPIFVLGGDGNGSTWVDMYKPTLGAVDPKYFAIPSGNCLYVNSSWWWWTNSNGAQSSSNWISTALKESLLFSKKVADAPKLVNRQAPPTIAQTFTAKFQLNVKAASSPPFEPYTLYGKVGFDFTKSGFYAMITEIDGAIPFSLQTGLVIHPDRNGIEFLTVDPEGDCYSLFFLQWFWTYLLPPFEVPPDAVRQGEAIINGDKCSIWNYWWGDFYLSSRSVTLYIRESDGAIVRGLGFDDPTWTNQFADFTLTDIELSVDPSLYSRPNTCVETMTWNPNFDSHLPWYWCMPLCDVLEPFKQALFSVI